MDQDENEYFAETDELDEWDDTNPIFQEVAQDAVDDALSVFLSGMNPKPVARSDFYGQTGEILQLFFVEHTCFETARNFIGAEFYDEG